MKGNAGTKDPCRVQNSRIGQNDRRRPRHRAPRQNVRQYSNPPRAGNEKPAGGHFQTKIRCRFKKSNATARDSPLTTRKRPTAPAGRHRTATGKPAEDFAAAARHGPEPMHTRARSPGHDSSLQRTSNQLPGRPRHTSANPSSERIREGHRPGGKGSPLSIHHRPNPSVRYTRTAKFLPDPPAKSALPRLGGMRLSDRGEGSSSRRGATRPPPPSPGAGR